MVEINKQAAQQELKKEIHIDELTKKLIVRELLDIHNEIFTIISDGPERNIEGNKVKSFLHDITHKKLFDLYISACKIEYSIADVLRHLEMHEAYKVHYEQSKRIEQMATDIGEKYDACKCNTNEPRR